MLLYFLSSIMKKAEINGIRSGYTLFALCFLYALTGFFGCKKEQNVLAPQPCTNSTLTQAELDLANNFTVKTGVTGDTPDSVFFRSNPHDSSTLRYSSRDIFENAIASSDSVANGAIYIRKFYSIPDINHQDQRTLTKVMLMIRHCDGYFPDGGDWEYVNMKIDPTVDTVQHPNGILPAAIMPDNIADTSMASVARGKLLNHCGKCHEKRNTMGFLFLDK